jgi:hypothetical protein
MIGNRDILLNDKLDHVTNVFNMIQKILHAWHDSWFYTDLHDKMNLAFKEFTKTIKNVEYSNFKKKLASVQSVIDHLVTFMDEHFLWYAYPEDVPKKITAILHNAQNNL